MFILTLGIFSLFPCAAIFQLVNVLGKLDQQLQNPGVRHSCEPRLPKHTGHKSRPEFVQVAVIENELAVLVNKIGLVASALQLAEVIAYIVAGKKCEQDDIGSVFPHLVLQRQELLHRTEA